MKVFIFSLLALAAVLLGVLAAQTDHSFQTTIWSQLFWLAAGTIATTFFVNAILENDLATRRRKDDQFAFRTFTATTFTGLLQIVGAEQSLAGQIIASALAGNKQFAETAKNIAAFLNQPTMLDVQVHLAYYLDIASHLRDLAVRFIRLYAKDPAEMITRYQDLQALARRWRYLDSFPPAYAAYTNSLQVGDPERVRREGEFAVQKNEALQTLKETATYLANLAMLVARRASVPSLV